jgi:magnesium transporter
MRQNSPATRRPEVSDVLTVFPAPPAAPATAPAAGADMAIDVPPGALWPGAVWIDMFDPDEATRQQVEAVTGLHVPSREDLSEIESSSRIYREGDTLYLSVPSLVRGEGGDARTSPVGFVLSPDRLLTIRFFALPAFETYAARCRSGANADRTSISILLGLCEVLVDRIADVLEREGEELDSVSRRIFRPADSRRIRPRRTETELRALLRNVGRVGDLVSKIRDTLLGLGRIIPFVLANAAWITPDQKSRFKILRADIASLTDYDGHLAGKVQFLLEATLGFIGIEQNNIIRVLTVVSVVGVPPTFFASLWGMNYRNMPELDWSWGYPAAMLVILLSAVLPLVWFRVRGWL